MGAGAIFFALRIDRVTIATQRIRVKGMPDLRFTVRAQSAFGFCIWDNEKNGIATSSGKRGFVDLRFDEALALARQLNAQEPPKE